MFKEGYVLRSLEEVEDFVGQYRHLPEIPSAKEVEESGMQLGQMNALLLKKVEELTLYIIGQEKRISQLEGEMNQLNQD